MKLDSAAFVAEKELINALKKRSTPINCEQDVLLFNQGDEATGLYILHNGEVRLTMKSLTGDQVLSMAAAPDSLLGLPGLLGNAAYSLSAYARMGAEVSFVSKDEFSRLMLSEPSVSLMILRVLAAEVRTARMAISDK